MHVPDVRRASRRGKTTHRDPDPSRPYNMQPDTLRNRLMLFIAKWLPEWLAFEQGTQKPEKFTLVRQDHLGRGCAGPG